MREMLETVEMGKIPPKEAIEELKIQIGRLEREARFAGLPVVIVLEGWNASGISLLSNTLLRTLDPRGVDFFVTGRPDVEESAMPFIWRFWTRAPAAGRITLYDRSWLSRLIVESGCDPLSEEWKRACRSVCTYERQLADSGAVFIKLFLHISEKEQKRRFSRSKEDPCLAYYVKKNDWNPHRDYPLYLPLIEKALIKTDSPEAPWIIIGADNRHYAAEQTLLAIRDGIENGLARQKTGEILPESISLPSGGRLPPPQPGEQMERDAYKSRKKEAGERIRSLQPLVYKKKIPVIIVFEGGDAAGKGGTIVRLARFLNPRGYRIWPTGAPGPVAEGHHYLWRFYTRMPHPGHISIFDRSWYGRVLVERVEGLCTDEEWRRSYREINEMEEDLLDWGALILKFWLTISPEEQLRRFRGRKADPDKNWKITPEDWRNRSRREEYDAAVQEMLMRTGPPSAPWTLVDAEDKYSARIAVLERIAEAMEEAIEKK